MDSTSISILVVDDQHANLFAMEQMLEPLRVNLLLAQSASEGLRLMLKEKVDILLLDYSMPEMSGTEMAALINQQFKEPPPILFITAHGKNLPGLQGECYELGAIDFIEKPVQETILLAKLRVLITLVQQREDLRRLASIDPMTQLANRTSFEKQLIHHLSLANRHGRQIALIAFDLDDFKAINDLYGHDAGDKMLRTFAKRLRARIRESDIPARLGGDEFICLLSDIQQPDDALRVAEDVLQHCKEPFKYNDNNLAMKLSVGIAIYPEHGLTAEDLYKAADIALYEAKSAGKGQVRVSHAENDLCGEASLSSQLGLRYQPILEAEDDHAIGGEVLSKLACSDDFGSIKDTITHIRRLGQSECFLTVLREQLAQDLPRFSIANNQENFSLFLNMSVEDFQHGVSVEQLLELHQLFNKYNIQLVLDLLDWDTYRAKANFISNCHELKQQGVHLCIQDIGNEVIPLAILEEIRPQYIKLSRNFTPRVVEDPVVQETIRFLNQYAAMLGSEVVALGVERKEQFHMLRQLGCMYFQGYFWDHALENKDFSKRWLSPK